VLSRRASAWLLFAAAALALPLPYYLGEVEYAPWVRLAFFTGIYVSVFVAEGAAGTTGLFIGLGAAQTVVYALLLRAGSGLLARSLERLAAPRLRGGIAAAIALSLLLAGLTPFYDTPLSRQRARSSLLVIFE
jgi:hypothetical protein